MKRFLLALGLAGACTAALAQPAPVAAPTIDQATQALQNAMQREIQAMNAEQGPGFDSNAATGVVKTLEVKSIDNCRTPPAGQGVACQVRTTAELKGPKTEETNTYHFWQQGGRWEARLPSGT